MSRSAIYAGGQALSRPYGRPFAGAPSVRLVVASGMESGAWPSGCAVTTLGSRSGTNGADPVEVIVQTDRLATGSAQRTLFATIRQPRMGGGIPDDAKRMAHPPLSPLTPDRLLRQLHRFALYFWMVSGSWLRTIYAKVRAIPEVAVENRGTVRDTWRFGIGEFRACDSSGRGHLPIPNAASVLARYHLDIEVQYMALAKDYHDPGSGDSGHFLATNTHACEVRRDGTVKVSKGPRGRGGAAHFEWRNPHIRLNT